ncbi:MAG TPA: TIGR04255 family protein [Bacteroidota bacterium]|nr:TIGR04255 family protein [Bacteroidota bacterium]
MERKILKNKPLVEAIFETRWKLQEPVPGIKVDPHYKILLGRIYDRVKDEYPFHEQLPTAAMLDEFAGYVVQHRFRRNNNEWPLIQIGPGIITLNDTKNYTWEDFEKRICSVVNILFDAYPDAENNLEVNWLSLRYIDTVDFNNKEGDVFSFLKNLKINIEVYEKLFEGNEVSNSPLGFDLRLAFSANEPKGAVHLRFVKDAEALKWETQVQSANVDVPAGKEQIIHWGTKAHELTDDWFFKMIDGELLRRFE